MARATERLATLALALVVLAAAGAVGLGVFRSRHLPGPPASGDEAAPPETAAEGATTEDAVAHGASDEGEAAAASEEGGTEAEDAGTPCEALAAANAERTRAAQAASDAGCPVSGPDITCVDAHGVMWGWRVDSVSLVRTGDTDFYCTSTFGLSLVRRAADGGVVSEGHEEAKYDWATKADRRDLSVLADYDGDGLDEVLATHETAYSEAARERRARVLTWKNGAIAEYAPAKGIAVEAIEDMDGDGRPDLMTRGPYAAAKRADAFANAWPVAPIVFAAHSRVDGTFSSIDDAARARAHKACPARPEVTLVGDETDALAIVCARLWGIPVAPIVAAIRAKCPDMADSSTPWESCRPWEEALARIEPPFRLDRSK